MPTLTVLACCMSGPTSPTETSPPLHGRSPALTQPEAPRCHGCPIYMEPCSHTQMPTEAAQGKRQAGPACLRCHGHSGVACGPGTLGPEATAFGSLGGPQTHGIQNHGQPCSCGSLAKGMAFPTAPQSVQGWGGGCRGSCQGTALTLLGHTSHGHMPVCPGAEWSFQSQHDRVFHRYAH